MAGTFYWFKMLMIMLRDGTGTYLFFRSSPVDTVMQQHTGTTLLTTTLVSSNAKTQETGTKGQTTRKHLDKNTAH